MQIKKRIRVAKCRRCGAKGVYISRRSKLCLDCITKKIKRNVKSLSNKKGKPYEKWKEGILRFSAKLTEGDDIGNLEGSQETQRI